MGLLEKIRVLCDRYNLDYQNGSGIWPQESILMGGAFYLDNIKKSNPSVRTPFSLPDGVLPANTLLEFPDQSNLYVVIGENGIGKTTFLKTIARALANAQHFETHKRTRLFKGTLGLRESISNAKSFTVPEDNTAGLIEINYSYIASAFLVNQLREDYTMKALRFYLSRHEVFDSPYYRTLQRFSSEEIASRLSYHIFLKERDDEREIPEKYKSRPLHSSVKEVIQEIAEENKIDFDEVVRRFCYLIEMANPILQRDLPINVYGEYELGLRLPASKISVGIFDHNLQPDGTMSKGQYARSSLEKFLEEESVRVLLVDEPTGNTDMKTSAWIYGEWLPQIASTPNTDIFIASHDPRICEIVKKLGGLSVDMYQRPAQVRHIDL